MIPYDISIKYMTAGYTAIFVLLIGFVISLVVRWRRLKQDLQMLETMEKDK